MQKLHAIYIYLFIIIYKETFVECSMLLVEIFDDICMADFSLAHRTPRVGVSMDTQNHLGRLHKMWRNHVTFQ